MQNRDVFDPERVVNELGQPELLETLRLGWEQAMEKFPAQGSPSFLDPEEFLLSREWCGFGAEHDAVLKDVAGKIRNNPVLCRLAWFYVWKAYEAPPQFAVSSKSERLKLEKALGDQAGIFYLLIGLAMVPYLRRYHRLLGVQESLTRETSRQVYSFCDNHQRAYGGKPGICHNQYYWLRNYTRDNLYFRIGRLEYWAEPFKGPVTVYRHRRTGRILALANDGTCFNQQGFMDGKEKRETNNIPSWTASLRLTEDAVCGFPVSPCGMAEQREVRLPFGKWKQVLGAGDPALSIHIPAGGNMSLENCGDSLTKGYEFFKSYFPHRTPVAFRCVSWIFSPCLEQCLPEKSNLVRFLRETYLFPVPSTNPNLWFVFFQEKFDPATAPRETSLQRALLDYITAGNTWRDGGMFYLTDDLPSFGTQYYRSNRPEL
jgi:hypothetical protein